MNPLAGSSWILGSYASMLSKIYNLLLRPLENKDFKEGDNNQIGMYDSVKTTAPAIRQERGGKS